MGRNLITRILSKRNNEVDRNIVSEIVSIYWGMLFCVQRLWIEILAQGEPDMAEAMSQLGHIAPTDELREVFSRLHATLRKLHQLSMLFEVYGSMHDAYAKDLGCIPSIEPLVRPLAQSVLLTECSYVFEKGMVLISVVPAPVI
jgi:hypothetical protein